MIEIINIKLCLLIIVNKKIKYILIYKINIIIKFIIYYFIYYRN